MAKAIEPFEKKAAKERQVSTLKQGDESRSEKFTEREKGEAKEKIAAVGVSRPTLEKATAVVEAAEADPVAFGPVAEKMDRTGKVDPAYKKVIAAPSSSSPPHHRQDRGERQHR